VSQVKPTILVTGGAGYIGSHAVLALKNAGYSVIVLDNLSYGHAEIIKDILKVELIVGDTRDRSLLDNLFASRDIAAVMHFAAFIAVGESVQEPAIYYQNNVSGSLTLLQAMIAADVKKFVFSSTCAIYGMPRCEEICFFFHLCYLWNAERNSDDGKSPPSSPQSLRC